MLEALALLVLVLAVVTVLGHGLWLLLAAIFRAISGRRPESDLWPRCPECQSRLFEPAHCRQCQWDATRGRSQAPSVSMVREEIDRLLRDEQISSAVHAQLLRALATTRRPGSVAAQPSTAQPDPSVAPATTDPSPVASAPKSARDESEGFVVAELVTDRSAAGAPPKPSVPAQPADPSRLSQEPPQVTPPAVGPPVAPAAKGSGPSGPDSVPQRAAAYRQRRAKAEAETAEQVRSLAPPSPSLPAEPRQPWLAAFMEEKHIRWGELVGGLMIVASSIALVVSFWSAIAERPVLKFGVLNGVTAALFGIGMYAAKRWKLPTTSQGILLTATLLVPLNFLAIAAFSEGSEQLSLPVLVGESFSTILLGSLVFMATKIITPSWPISVSAGIILPALGQLVLRRHIDAASPTPQVYAFALAGLSVYLGSQVPVLWRFRSEQHKPLDERQGNEVFKQLGLVTFSLAVAIGLLLVKAEQPVERLQWLAPLSILLAAPAMACGLLLWKRPGSAEHSIAMAGTTLAVASAGLAVAGLLLAWPQPGLLVACCAMACLALLLMAWWYEIDEAHAAVAALASLGGALNPALAAEYTALVRAIREGTANRPALRFGGTSADGDCSGSTRGGLAVGRTGETYSRRLLCSGGSSDGWVGTGVSDLVWLGSCGRSRISHLAARVLRDRRARRGLSLSNGLGAACERPAIPGGAGAGRCLWAVVRRSAAADVMAGRVAAACFADVRLRGRCASGKP